MASTSTRTRSTAKKATTRATRQASAAKKRVTKAAKRTPAATKRDAKSAKKAARPSVRRVDAISLLKQDHREVQVMFRRFERAGSGAKRTKALLVEQIIEALSRHASIEELVFYPAVRREVRGSTSDVLEAIEEHHVVKLLLHELEDLDPANERFDAKVTVLIENVRHHVGEEETELFPRVRKALTRTQLLDIGDALRAAKPGAPTRPHPYAPDTPPVNALVGGAVAALDRARTVGKKAVERVRDEIPAL